MTTTEVSSVESGSAVPGSNGDQVLGALQSLALVLEQNAEEERLLAERIRKLIEVRHGGASWLEALQQEEQPGTIHLVSSVLGRLSSASGAVRRELVFSLRAEKVTIPVIARLFGVTHQRVSNLLRRPPTSN